MALEVETGTGSATAESYAAVADVDTYVLAFAPSWSAAWSALATSAKEAALRRSTQAIEALYSGKWPGYRLNADQALGWPQQQAVDVEGILLDAHSVPFGVRNACIELAGRAAVDGTLLADVAAGGNITSEAVKAGSVSRAVEYSGSKAAGKVYSLVGLMLRRYTAGARVYRG